MRFTSKKEPSKHIDIPFAYKLRENTITFNMWSDLLRIGAPSIGSQIVANVQNRNQLLVEIMHVLLKTPVDELAEIK